MHTSQQRGLWTAKLPRISAVLCTASHFSQLKAPREGIHFHFIPGVLKTPHIAWALRKTHRQQLHMLYNTGCNSSTQIRADTFWERLHTAALWMEQQAGIEPGCSPDWCALCVLCGSLYDISKGKTSAEWLARQSCGFHHQQWEPHSSTLSDSPKRHTMGHSDPPPRAST